ncbi:MAG TPA: nucleotidyltransferase family protein [Ferruginibacter sp.]|nr:nucleotidyltransferase family protein [Ferruginibacter sp.]
MIKEAVILAGGLGTRLRSVVAELPKCMANVAGKPFIYYVVKQLQNQGIEKFIFSLGYKHEVIEAYINTEFAAIHAQFVIENEPLGTGGAIQLACRKTTTKDVLVLNGDTMFSIDVQKLAAAHTSFVADCTLSLKPMEHFDRYGVVELNKDHTIASFKEKQFYEKGLINGGVYALQTENFLQKQLPEKFSFEKDYLEKYFIDHKMYGDIQDEYFIDIGIPEDYQRAQIEFEKW